MILVVELLGQPQSGRLVQLELEGVVDADVKAVADVAVE